MLKSLKKVNIIKEFSMEYSVQTINPAFVKDEDIYAIFSGLFKMMQNHANRQATLKQKHNEQSYNFLLKMYLNTLKSMNKYKTLYLESTSKNNSIKI